MCVPDWNCCIKQINASLFICTCTINKAQIILILKVKKVLQTTYYVLNDIQLVFNTLFGFHAYIGCDMVSTFSGKGKVKPLKLMMKNGTPLHQHLCIDRRRSRNLNIMFRCLSRICLCAIMVIKRIPLTMLVTRFTHWSVVV